MQVKLARTAGFCMGVKRAVDKTLAVTGEGGGPVYTLGPLIHNRQVIDWLVARGVKVCEEPSDVESGKMVIRAHGVPQKVLDELESAGLAVVDATCPHVLRSQNAIRQHSSEGYQVVIAGDRDHAEVIGLLGYCTGSSALVSSVEDAEQVELSGKVCLIAQTTFNESTYEAIAAIIRRRQPSAVVLNTICRATHERQEEARELAASVDAMVVVGARHSANTCRLAEIARETNTPTFHVENADELDPAQLAQYTTVGITAGASTPQWITRPVIRRLERIGRRPTVAGTLWQGLEVLVESSIYTGIAAVGLTYGCHLLQQGHGADVRARFLAYSFCYIFSVHIWNRMRQRVENPNATSRLVFFTQHARLLIALSMVLSIGSVVLAAALGEWITLLLLTASYGVGVIYNVRVVPVRWAWLPYQRLKDIPASKDVFSAAALATVAVILPSLAAAGDVSREFVNIGGAFFFAFAAGIIRTTMLDFTDIQADRTMGRDTLPTLIGMRKTLAVLSVLAALMAVVLVFGTATGHFRSLGYWMLIVPAYIFVYLHGVRRQVVARETLCLLVADGTLLLMGVVAFAWNRIVS